MPALYLLALMVALLTGCGSAGKPGTFSSQNYGYSTALPAGWSGHQAAYPWNGGGSPGFEDSDIDLFGGPNGITVIAHGAIAIGGGPARLLSIQCQGLSIETAITIHAGKAIVFTSQLSSGTRADRAAFRRFLTGIRVSAVTPYQGPADSSGSARRHRRRAAAARQEAGRGHVRRSR